MKATAALAATAQVVVGTPGRIFDMVCHEPEPVLLPGSIRLLVLDEADKLLAPGLAPQLNGIFSQLPDRKQMLTFSATYPSELNTLVAAYMREPVHVRLNVDSVSLEGVTQFVEEVMDGSVGQVNEAKLKRLLRLLSRLSFRQCVVFCNLRTRATKLASALREAGYPTGVIMGGMQQLDRNSTMANFRSFKIRVLVSTDLTARGIDVERVNLVVNLDLPIDAATYLHRIGRTGRFGSRGVAVTFISQMQHSSFVTLLADANTKALPLPTVIETTMCVDFSKVSFKFAIS